MRFVRLLSALLFAVCILTGKLFGYSVLSHEAVIDALWDVKLKQILLAEYPNSTPDEMRRAHGYAYGGAIIQDLGYYPHGSPQFSDLTHYVRTGDFILALLREAHDLNEMSFALGAMSHYVGDLDGHRYATNVGEPILYPKMREKFGAFVTYEQNPENHLKTEYGFDVLEVAKGNFAPQAYHDFIGFYVSKELLSRAFRDTYGLELSDVFSNFDRAIEEYRSAVSRIIPMATRIAWAQKRSEIQKSEPGVTRRHFIYIMRRSSYEKEWGKRLDEPNWFERLLAFLLRLVPPIGPLKALQLRMPTPQVENLFMASFNRCSAQYGDKLGELQAKTLLLPNENYDVGVVTPAGTYRLQDEIEVFWTHKLAGKHFDTVTPEIRSAITGYFGDLHAPISVKKEHKKWTTFVAEYSRLNGSLQRNP